jgi:hypothetical protein
MHTILPMDVLAMLARVRVNVRLLGRSKVNRVAVFRGGQFCEGLRLEGTYLARGGRRFVRILSIRSARHVSTNASPSPPYTTPAAMSTARGT